MTVSTSTSSPTNPYLAALTSTPEPRSLLGWMEWLYTRSANEATLTGALGVWPEELEPFLTGLCCAYTPSDAEPAPITLAPGLLTPEPASLSRRAKTCLLLFSGGKDSIAAGLLAEDAGYTVYAVHIRRINQSYPGERLAAETIAARLGWPLLTLTPERLARTRVQSVIKNEYAIAFALHTFGQQYGWLPEIASLGTFLMDDCHATPWYSDMEPALRTFASALTAAYGSGPGGMENAPRLVTWLTDERHSITTWATHPRLDEATRALTASCITPQYSKPLHRKRLLTAGVPLLAYDCGVCEKCYTRALILNQLDPERYRYPASYLKQARKTLAKAFALPLWCHAHPSLETAFTDDSAAYLLDVVFAGTLVGAEPRRNTNHAIPPTILRRLQAPTM